MELVVIAQIVALLCLSALCIYMIIVLRRARDIMTNVEKDVKEIAARTVPVLENLEYITSRVKGITDSIDDQVTAVRESIASIKMIADNVVDLERRVQYRIEGPLLETVGFVAAVFKGVRKFLDRVRA
ncbi:MAG TPA: DUF948 domain-containing protein [Bacteroidota bacterium]|nr:DUF948 domain-containing protein [Bacteroidota bacterium]